MLAPLYLGHEFLLRSSALRVDTFCKHVHVVEVDQPAFARVAPAVATLANVEGLVEHARSVTIREES